MTLYKIICIIYVGHYIKLYLLFTCDTIYNYIYYLRVTLYKIIFIIYVWHYIKLYLLFTCDTIYNYIYYLRVTLYKIIFIIYVWHYVKLHLLFIHDRPYLEVGIITQLTIKQCIMYYVLCIMYNIRPSKRGIGKFAAKPLKHTLRNNINKNNTSFLITNNSRSSTRFLDITLFFK